MKTTLRTCGQALLLLVLGVVVGLGANAVREKRIYLWQDYDPTTKPDPNSTDAPPTAEPNIPYAIMSVGEVAVLLDSPDTQVGLNVIVDARNEELFAQGHIPGAVQCDPYGPPTAIDDVAGRLAGTAKVVVYCHGGSCEDSVLLCNYLVARGIPKETLYVFKDGWDGWLASKNKVATGRE